MRGYSEIANFLKVVGVTVGKLISIRISRIAMSSQEYNQSINVITQYYILHKIIFTNVNYITISWLNTLRRRPCSRNLGCWGGGGKTVLYLQGESKDEKAEQRGISVYSSPDSVFVSVAGSRFLLFSSHLAWKKISDLLIFWFFITTDWQTSWIASLLG